ncbi:crossover junction endodeoxyribonuclease [Kluyveromyces lactis]|uniref:KLLA0A01320p n=1 Tax=Kluyveromyces lactis (strain ATCC 8585 / CBS 2359 / DSM 70799 / NBRC 1267 / NRRL Y-1140 / WM37) TaxID=284590 RepID=Q6CYD2_KLULA|nr:uncharacterized protein KLLA0_A01320g [Kluyveromyces lactis]CAH02645.1 KLLA0A01320p [Kluyveromyces lactis]|eukprot:XP_451057.1 uncharacterized protein KLLA0_A01320g [Kluyveromyces lactis]
MGSSELWNQISQYNVPRVAFKQFVAEFVEKNGRFPRIAIDGYLWLFECGYFDEPQNKSKTLLNWLRKLKEMLHLQCFIVIIFDGTFKLDGKRRKKRKVATLWDSYWLMRSMNRFNHDSVSYVDDYIIECCKLFNIQTINAPGEGEAQCAFLQLVGQVDFVLSNDADVLSFGASKVLKNYSKHGWQDLPNSSNSPVKSKQNERFVTFVDLDIIKDWDRDRFVLFNLLVGSDYNGGVKGLGGKRAAILSKSREPDISKKLPAVLADAKFEEKAKIQHKWEEFGEDILRTIKKNGKTLFGMNLKSMNSLSRFKDWPDVTVGLFYRDPIVQNFDLSSKPTHADVKFEEVEAFMKLNGIPRFLMNFDKWFHEFLHQCFIVSYIWKHPDPFNGNYRLTEYHEVSLCDGMHQYKEVCVRFKSFLFTEIQKEVEGTPKLQNAELPSRARFAKIDSANSPRKSPAKSTILRQKYPYYMWIPTGVIPKSLLIHLDKEIAAAKTSQALRLSSKKSSPKKTRGRSLSPQKNTLDRFLNKRQRTEGPMRDLISALLQEQTNESGIEQKEDREIINPNKAGIKILNIDLIDTESEEDL